MRLGRFLATRYCETYYLSATTLTADVNVLTEVIIHVDALREPYHTDCHCPEVTLWCPTGLLDVRRGGIAGPRSGT